MAFDDQMSLENISKLTPKINEAWDALKALANDKSHTADRTTAIIGGALVEHALRVGLESKFRGDLTADDRKALFSYQENGALCDLAKRVRVAYALDLFGPETRHDLLILNRIRNGFAHSAYNVHFGLPGVAVLCEKLKLPKSKFIVATIETPKQAYIALVNLIQNTFRIKVTVKSATAGGIKISTTKLP